MTTTAAVYARLSHDKRKGTAEEGSSVASQVDACKAFIAAKGWTLGKVYRDDSISATSGAVRPAFEELLSDAPPIVVAFKQDRLSRDVTDTLRIKAAGVTGYMCDGGKLDFSTADSGMLTMFRTVIDAAEGQKKSERQKLATIRDAKAGKYRGSIRPFGQTLKGEWVEGEAEAVQKAAHALVEGAATFYKVALEWNAQELLTPQSGREWTAGTVRNFFSRPRLKGYQAYEGTLYRLKDWEPLLTEEQFEHIQAMIDSKKTGRAGVQGSRHRPHLLTGIATCGICGRGMNVGYRGGSGSPRFYRCPTPKHVTRTADKLDRLVVDSFLVPLFSPNAEAVVNPQGTREELTALRKQRLDTEREHNEWLTEAVEASLKPSLLAAKEAKHLETMTALDERLALLDRDNLFSGLSWFPQGGEVDIRGFEQTAWEAWDKVPLERQRGIVQSMYSSIVVNPGKQGQRFNSELIDLAKSELLEALEKATWQWLWIGAFSNLK